MTIYSKTIEHYLTFATFDWEGWHVLKLKV